MTDELMQCRVLLVDDHPLILEKLKILLEPYKDIVFDSVTSAEMAVDAARKFRPTIILQDLVMPDIDGYELMARYREVEELSEVPVMILSANDDVITKEQCFRAGANDYLVKLPDTLELLARIRYHSSAYRARIQRDESFHLLTVSLRELADANMQLQKLNGIDALTGAGNRRYFDDYLAAEWGRGLRDQNSLSLIMCDIDNFKSYNDSFGHVSGDFCIKRIAAALTEQLRRPADKLARYGGEEFAIILPDTELAGALTVAENCRRHVEGLSRLRTAPDLKSPVTMSFGVVSMRPHNESSIQCMVEEADRALFEAKRCGRNTVKQVNNSPDEFSK